MFGEHSEIVSKKVVILNLIYPPGAFFGATQNDYRPLLISAQKTTTFLQQNCHNFLSKDGKGSQLTRNTQK